MKTVIDAKKDVVAAAADRIQCLVAEKPGAVLALAAGRTMDPLFAELAERCKKGELQLAGCRVFSVTEYVGAPAGLSCRHAIEEKLLNATDLREENCCFLSEDTLGDYDARIAAAGGLDLAVLGIGINAQIGFNEPVALFNSLTHRQKLSEVTRQQKAEQFGGLEAVPEYGLTMGVKTLILAREILLLAFGEEKAEAVFRMLYARNDGVFPAAFLELHAQAAAYLDEAAAAKL